jgi:hypothetical protein
MRLFGVVGTRRRTRNRDPEGHRYNGDPPES